MFAMLSSVATVVGAVTSACYLCRRGVSSIVGVGVVCDADASMISVKLAMIKLRRHDEHGITAMAIDPRNSDCHPSVIITDGGTLFPKIPLCEYWWWICGPSVGDELALIHTTADVPPWIGGKEQ